MKSKRWLLFVEDPGAVNYFLPIVEYFKINKINFRIWGGGKALALFKKTGQRIESYQQKSISSLKAEDAVVLVGTSENHKSPSFSLLKWAKEKNILSVALVDSGINASYRFCGRSSYPLEHAPDILLVPDKWALQKFEDLGFPRKKIGIVGYPARRTIGEKKPIGIIRKKLLPKNVSDKMVILFVSESPTGLCPDQFKKTKSFTLCGNSASENRTLIVIEEFLDAIRDAGIDESEKPYLILRLHPKETKDHLATVLKEFNYISRDEDPIELALCADLVIGMTSMLINEAYWAGCNCMVIVPRCEEKTWLPVVRSRHVPCASNRPELKKLLAKKIKNIKKRHFKRLRTFPQLRKAPLKFTPIKMQEIIKHIKTKTFKKNSPLLSIH